MVQKTCKRILMVPLLVGVILANSINGQTLLPPIVLPGTFSYEAYAPPGVASYAPAETDACRTGRCRPRISNRRPTPVKPPTVTPTDLHKAVIATRSTYSNGRNTRTVKHGYATCISYNGKFYIASCAHVWANSGTHAIVSGGKTIPVEILGINHNLDLAILKAIPGLYSMPLLLEKPPNGSSVCLNYRRGILEGYSSGNISVRGYVKNGDSGGPIYTNDGLIGIIATYSYANNRLYSGATSGPDANQIANFIKGLTVSPSSVPVPTTPAPLPSPPEKPPVPIKSGDCDLAKINKAELAAFKKRMDMLEQKTKDNALGSQRNKGAIDILQKEVIAQHKAIIDLDQSRKESALRIERLEKSSIALKKSITETRETLKGKMQFRLRIDQSGRVTGVESQ